MLDQKKLQVEVDREKLGDEKDHVTEPEPEQ